MATPKYVKKAHNTYNAKFDLVQIKLPKGTKDRIKSVLNSGQSMSNYCVQAVLNAIDGDSQNVREDGGVKAPETPEKEPEAVRPESIEEQPQKPDFSRMTRQQQNDYFNKIVVEKKALEKKAKREAEERKEMERQKAGEELQNKVIEVREQAKKERMARQQAFSQLTNDEIKDELMRGGEFAEAIGIPANKDAYVAEIGEDNYMRCLECLAEIEREEKERKRAESIQKASLAE